MEEEICNSVIAHGNNCHVIGSETVLLRCNDLKRIGPKQLFIDNEFVDDDLLREELIRFYQKYSRKLGKFLL